MKTIDDIRNEGRLLYHYVAGSTLYHCNEEGSDVDTKGLFIASPDELYGLGFDKQFRDKWKDTFDLYPTQIGDDKADNVFYEVGKYMGMLLSSNANVLESLFVPEEMMIVKPHKCLEGFFANRDKFITKACFKPFVQYAIEQVHKARGLNKKIVNPITERKGVLDFAYTFYNQGSTNIVNWLSYRGLKQEYCGLVNIPNMRDVYGCYYDWGRHFQDDGIKYEDLVKAYNMSGKVKLSDAVEKWKSAKDEVQRKTYEHAMKKAQLVNMVEFIFRFYKLKENGLPDISLKKWFESQKPIGYSGMAGENSNELRLSSVSKGERPICYVSYNKDGYTKHCIAYKEYKDWEKNRNPRRYESNLNKNYDSKNMYHCFRLMRMGKEIANGDGLILNREEAGDRPLIMDIRHHKFEYDEIMALVTKEEEELNAAIASSKLPEEIDFGLVNDILIDIRKKYYGML